MGDVTLETIATEIVESEDSEQEQVENAQPEAEAQNDELQDDVEVEEEQDESAEEEDQPDEPESLDDRVIEWETASGDKFSVPVAELKTGYMREQDYRHKTQELAKERDEAYQQVHQQFQFAEQFAQELGALHSQDSYIGQIEAAIGQIDRVNDPVNYNATVNELILARQQREGLATQISQVRQQRTVEQQQNLAAAKQQAMTELTTGANAIPNFNQELIKQINTSANKYGYSDQELALVADPRHIRVLHDAMQYRALQAKQSETVSKVKQAPQKRVKQSASKPASGVEKDIKRLNAKNDLNSFAAALAHTL